MKKALTVSLLVVLVLMLACTGVKANAKRDDLKEKILAEAKKAGITVGESEVEAALPEDVTDAEYDQVVGQIELMKKTADGKEMKDLTKEAKQTLLSQARVAAGTFGLKINVNSEDGKITVADKNGKVIASRNYDETGIKLVQTGSDNLVFVVLAGVAIIAIAGTVAVKKVRANA